MTDPKEELEKGRIALWLDPSDIKFIADEWRKMPKDAPDSDREKWARLAFRAMTALHKNGIRYEPIFTDKVYYLSDRET